MSTVVPSKQPAPISRRKVAELRSDAMFQAALRTRAGNICSSVCARASAMRSSRPLAGSTGCTNMGMPTGFARSRAIGSRRRSSSRLPRSSPSGLSSATAPDGDSRGLLSSRSPTEDLSSLGLRGCPSCEKAAAKGGARGSRSGRRKAAKEGSVRDRSVRGSSGTRADLRVGAILITKEYRTATKVVAYKVTGGVP